MQHFTRRDIFLKIEPIAEYSPLAPLLCARHYGRDCMFNEGHESGRLSLQEIFGATLDALVFHEYLDPDYTVPNTAKLIESDVNEPPWERRVPGCVLYAKPGERLFIHVLNGDRKNCHSFHLHGLKYGIDSDGAWPLGVQGRDGSRSDEIRPGQRWTYVFEATPNTIGAWAFHTHVRQVQSFVDRGLFGGLIVRDPSAPCADHEIPLFMHVMQGGGQGCQFQSPSLSAGQTFSFTFGQTPGICKYFCLIHGITMSGQVQVVTGGPASAPVVIGDNFFSPATVLVGPGGTVTWTQPGERNHIVFAGGGGGSSFCLNGRAFVGNTPTVEVEAEERLRWYVFNLDFGGVWHNFHPHSTRWELPVPPGGAADVHSLSPAESFVADTEAPPALRLPCILEDLQCDPPADACRVRLKGDFLFHCHVESHMMQGLAGLLRSRQYVWLNQDVARRLPIQLPLDDGANECPPVDIFRCQPRKRPPEIDIPLPTTPPHQDDPHQPPAGPHGHGGPVALPSNVPVGTGPLDVSQAATKGLWELLPCESPVRIVHAALLHTGKVFFFSGSGDDEQFTAGFGSAVWDYENGIFHVPLTPVDFFCAGQSFLTDGKLLVAGGTKEYNITPAGFKGSQNTYLFDPILEEWIRLEPMKGGRWYPSLLTLANGEVLAASGLSENGPINLRSEVYSTLTGWRFLNNQQDPGWPLYPNLTLLQDGALFFSGGSTFGTNLAPGRLDLATNTIAPINAPGFDLAHRDQCGTVLLPPAQAQKVMIMGGGGPAPTPTVNTVAIADLSVAAASYTPANPMHTPRMHLNAVLLPDRTVMVSGGESEPERPARAALEAEIYHPGTGQWTRAAKATVPRMYHSVAVLLPDGRVIAAGSNAGRRDNELRLELYHPPYLFHGPRPSIESAPQQVVYGGVLDIHTPQATEIKWVHLIRPMATTHSCDTEQRLVELKFEHSGFCRLRAHLPRNPNLAPPGWYMLFLVDRHDVPSVAKFVHLGVDESNQRIKTLKIHPSIGIARVGNSPTEFFVGPEKPGDRTPAPGGYKDAHGRIKRQAARFRIFGYDEKGRLVKEVADADASISWTAHLANKKAAWKEFAGPDPNAPLRNAGVNDRNSLIIDPGPRTVSNPNQTASFDTGTFMGTVVPLGEIRMEETGRLLVLGGLGHSTSPTNAPLPHFANNDGWHDDVSHGPVTATVTLNGFTQAMQASGAWAIVAPTDFAPALDSITSLYEVLRQVAADKLGWKPAAKPSFTNDIYPVLKRVLQLRWVSQLAGSAHSTLAQVIPPPGSDAMRALIFSHLRNPNDGSGGDMPMLYSDTEELNEAVTRLQYSLLEKWKDGDFINDWAGPPEPAEEITPEGLDRASIEACAGGAFFPGIDAGWFIRDVYEYTEPFRLNGAQLQPGDVTKQMAVPWQADFFDCQASDEAAWWPSQRPDDVYPEGGGGPAAWTRNLVNSHLEMVLYWHRLGFVVRTDDGFLETERG